MATLGGHSTEELCLPPIRRFEKAGRFWDILEPNTVQNGEGSTCKLINYGLNESS